MAVLFLYFLLFLITTSLLIIGGIFVVTYILQQELFLHVPTLRTKHDDLSSLLSEGYISAKDIVYDLGSGNGQTLFLIEKQKGAETHGIELGITPSVFSRILKKINSHRTTFYFKNLLTADISNATVIYAYLLPAVVVPLEKTIKERVKNGTTIILCDYPFTTLSPTTISQHKRHTFYIYNI